MSASQEQPSQSQMRKNLIVPTENDTLLIAFTTRKPYNNSLLIKTLCNNSLMIYKQLALCFDGNPNRHENNPNKNLTEQTTEK